MSEEIRIAVRDTQGPQALSVEARNALPHVEFSGWSPEGVDPVVTHPHGFMCSWFAAILHFPKTVKVRFYQKFHADGKYVGAQAEREMESDIIDFAPTDVNNSVGAKWDDIKDNPAMVEAYKLDAEWWEGVKEKCGNPRDNWAAGNEENPDLRKNDAEDDVAAPQRFMSEAVIVGSTDVEGIPSGFSSDGPRVDCSGWGEYRWLLEFDKWVAGSGTSFSCPEVCGIRSVLGLDYDAFMARLKADPLFGTRPEGWTLGEHHWKFGYANLMSEFQWLLRERVPVIMWPPHAEVREQELAWMDMKDLRV